MAQDDDDMSSSSSSDDSDGEGGSPGDEGTYSDGTSSSYSTENLGNSGA